MLPAVTIDKETLKTRLEDFVERSVHQYTAFVPIDNTDNGDTDDNSSNAEYRTLYEILKPGNEQNENYKHFRSNLSKYLILNRQSEINPQKLAFELKKTVFCWRTKNVYEPNGIIWSGKLTRFTTFNAEFGKRLPSIIRAINDDCKEIAGKCGYKKFLEEVRDQQEEGIKELIDETDLYNTRLVKFSHFSICSSFVCNIYIYLNPIILAQRV